MKNIMCFSTVILVVLSALKMSFSCEISCFYKGKIHRISFAVQGYPVFPLSPLSVRWLRKRRTLDAKSAQDRRDFRESAAHRTARSARRTRKFCAETCAQAAQLRRTFGAQRLQNGLANGARSMQNVRKIAAIFTRAPRSAARKICAETCAQAA